MTNQPNILFILSDQHRADCLGRVNPVVKTPHLDALASRGVAFSDAVCQGPMCVPSRHSLMTGLYPSQLGVRHNTQCFPKEGRLPAPTLPERLRAAGYRTAGYGKTHWRVGECRGVPFGAAPLGRRGFDVRAVLAAKEREGDCRAYEDEADPEVWEALCREQAAGGPGGQRVPGYLGRTSEVPAEAHGESWLARQARAFLEGHEAGRQPFFLYFSCDVPHPTFMVPPGYEDRYRLDGIELPEQPPEGAELAEHTPFGLMNRAEWSRLGETERRRGLLRYYAYCSYMDDLVGELVGALEATGQLENTLIVYTSDHGEMLGERNYRFAKCCLYEGSLRVPMIAAGPGAGAPSEGGRVDDRPAELVDLAPTFLRAAGVQAPPELPGLDLFGGRRRTGNFAELHGEGYHEPAQMGPCYAWRSGEWKLILTLPGLVWDGLARLDEARGELYNLREDPGEWFNRYESPELREVREKLTRDLLMYLACQWAKFPLAPSQCPVFPDPANPGIEDPSVEVPRGTGPGGDGGR